MGEVGKFFLGGSGSKQTGQNSYTNESQNAAQNSSVNASLSRANNFQKSGSQGSNRAYDPIAAAMSPALGYVTQAGDMMGALLGLPPSSFSYTPSSMGPVMPAGGAPSAPSLDLSGLVDQISDSLPTPQTPAPPPPLPSAQPAPSTIGDGGHWLSRLANLQKRELGGPVTAGEPYLVGEKQPEVFVPQQSGTILPQASEPMMQTMASTQGGRTGGLNLLNLLGRNRPGRTGSGVTPSPAPVPTAPAAPAPTTVSTQVNPAVNPTSALNTFSDSAGMNFLLEQGQKAISGDAAGRGVFNSGATGKGLLQYGQNLGKTYLNDYMDRLMSYGQLGLGAGSALSNAGGINQSQSLGGGGSTSGSAGVSQGSSYGTSFGSGSGTTDGKSSSKNGLLPVLASFKKS